jgi:hypothetical protein
LSFAVMAQTRPLLWVRRGRSALYSGELLKKSVGFSEPAFVCFADGARLRHFEFETISTRA